MLECQLANEFSLREGQSIAVGEHSLHVSRCHSSEGRSEFITGACLERLDCQPELVRGCVGQIDVKTRDLGERIDQLCNARKARDGFFEKLQPFSDHFGCKQR